MTAETDSQLRSPWLFLFGVALFLGSIALFAYDLATGNDAIRGVLANGVAAALVLALAGRETLSDPDSHIDTRGEAVRAMLFFYGIYLLLAGCVLLVAAALLHPDPQLGMAYVGAGAAVAGVTFLTGGAEEGILDRLWTLAGLAGLLLVAGSAVLFAYDLVTGRDVLRGIAASAVGAALFLLWTAHDMPSDPDSGVETPTDALGVVLLFYGGYLLVAGLTIALTGLLAHDRGAVGLLYLLLSVAAFVLGFLFAPVGTFAEDSPQEEPSEADGENATD